MKKSPFIPGVLALIFALVLSGCPSPMGGGDSGQPDKSGLNASIAAAKTTIALAAVSVTGDGTDVPLGTYWAAASDLAALQAAIAAAELAAATANSQTALNAAKTSLDNALETFKSVRKPGTASPVDKSALTAKIAAAENAQAGVQISVNGGDVARGTYWVTQSVWNVFDTAIDTAKTVQSTAISQTVLNAAVTALDGAITTFNTARLDGNKSSGFSAAELTALIARANDAKAGVKTSAVNGDDAGPGEYWVSQSALGALNTAIDNAQAAGEGNRDSRYVELSQAITAFNAAKATGTLPDKDSLFNAIRSADSAKEGVVEASGKTQVPAGGKWATAAQWAAINSAYESALATASNANASKNQVAAEVIQLNTAVSVFNSAVTANGPGEGAVEARKIGEITGTITLTNVPAQKPNVYIEVRNEDRGWLTRNNRIDLSGISGGGTVNWSIPLYEGDEFTGPIEGYFTLWVAAGENDDGYLIWIEPSKQINGMNANVGSLGTFSLASVTLSGTLSVTYEGNPVPNVRIFAETFEPYTFHGQIYLQTPGPNTAWTLPLAVFNSPSDVHISVEGFDINDVKLFNRYNVAMPGVQNANIPGISLNIGDITAPTQEGKLHGTVTFTNLPNPPPAEIVITAEYYDNNNGWNWISGDGISLNGATGSWTLPPLTDPINQQFLNALNTAGSLQVRFSLWVQYAQDESYPMIAEITKTITSGNLEVDLGTVAIPPTITLSGTFIGSYDGGEIPYVTFSLKADHFYGYDIITLNYPAVSGTAWKIRLEYLDSPQQLAFDITGYDSNRYPLFTRTLTPSQTASVYQSDISGITLNIGNIDTASQQAGKLHGTVTFTNLPNPPPDRIDIQALYYDNNGWTTISTGGTSISLNGAAGSWTLPPLADPINQQFLNALNTAGSLQVRFLLTMQYAQDAYYDQFAEITKTVTSGNLEVDLGTVAIPPGITLSGTFIGSYNSSVIPDIFITVYTDNYSVTKYITLDHPSTSGTAWSIRLPPLDSPQRIVFDIEGRNSLWQQLFTRTLTPSQTASVYQSDISGITLDVGNITD